MPNEYRSSVHLAYCEKNAERMVMADEFNALSERRDNFSWSQYYGEGPDVVRRFSKEAPTWSKVYRLFRICGHPGFQAAVRDELIAAGVKKEAIILEGVF